MNRPRTGALSNALGGISAEEWRMVPKLLAELPQSSFIRRLLVGCWAEHCVDMQHEDEVLRELAADQAAWLDEMERAAGIPPLPTPSGMPMTYDPDTGEIRPL